MMTASQIRKAERDFAELAEALQKQAQKFFNSELSLVSLDIPAATVWSTYLENIDKDYNGIFRERRYFDANFDKNFINRVGRLAAIDGDSIKSLWDIEISEDSIFTKSLMELKALTSGAKIEREFRATERIAGAKPNVDSYDSSIVWTHFFTEIPSLYVGRTSTLSTTASVFKRSLTEANIADIDTILALIATNAIYRGPEFVQLLTYWKTDINAYQNAGNKDAFLWSNVIKRGEALHYRNTAIGSLISNLYDGDDLETAVKKFEAVVAPSNYKRPSALITPQMIEEAKAKLDELGYSDSIYRRTATISDIPANHVLFTSQEARSLSVFDDLTSDAKASTAKVDTDKIKEIQLDELLAKLPELAKVELLPTYSLHANRVVMTAAQDASAPSMFKWDNSLAWAYINNGGGADAIKSRVKDVGGNVDGDIRISLSWHNADDLDLSMASLMHRQHIYFGNKQSFGGKLDVDMNVSTGGSKFDDEHPVENIAFENESDMVNGSYIVRVRNFNRRSNKNYGFDLQVEINGKIQTYTYANSFREKNEPTPMLRIEKNNGKYTIRILDDGLKLQSVTNPTEDKFIEVKSIMLSPNYWGDNAVGNKHVILTTEDYDVTEPVHGFFNEYLTPELEKNRKVTATLASKLMITDGLENALRGYGFSSTMGANFIIRVTTQKGRQQLVHVTVK